MTGREMLHSCNIHVSPGILTLLRLMNTLMEENVCVCVRVCACVLLIIRFYMVTDESYT